MLGTVEPVPTFSPSFDHASAGTSFGRFMLCASRHDDARFDDQRRATAVSVELGRRAARPWAARTRFVAAKNWASVEGASARAGETANNSAPTVATTKAR